MVARALVHEPRVLFLDEPTSGIDPQTRINLWRILEDLNRAGQTTLLTTHYMEEADVLCERIAIIDHGKALAVDTPAELKRKHGAETRDHGDRWREIRGRWPSAPTGSRPSARSRRAGRARLVRVHAARSDGVLVQLVEAAATLGLRCGTPRACRRASRRSSST